MIQIIDFRRNHFEGMVDCYRHGFPEGHNRYTLARLSKFQRDSIFLAVNDLNQVIGVLIGITSAREAWFTALTLLPNVGNPKQITFQLAYKLSNRLIELGFDEAFLTTERRSILRLVQRVEAPHIEEIPNCYFDGKKRWVVTVNHSNLPKLIALMN
ncbi:hypothetical protein IID19_00355 [Patescibacteria group bacterium]|nr:hypothetical protein [Patescibacteria group bacterium]